MRTLYQPEIEVAGRRLGRHVAHDPASRAYGVATTPALISVSHRHYGPVLNQGHLGSCTGNALSQALNTAGLHRTGDHLLKEDTAVKLYAAATALDPFPGLYPPDDTGSDGNSVCKAARDFGMLSGWQHAFSLDEALGALVTQPVIIGSEWTEGMDTPDPAGYLQPQRGKVRGGHEFVLLTLDVKRERVGMLNSWGSGWANGGRAWIRWADLEWLLSQQGDVTVPLR